MLGRVIRPAAVPKEGRTFRLPVGSDWTAVGAGPIKDELGRRGAREEAFSSERRIRLGLQVPWTVVWEKKKERTSLLGERKRLTHGQSTLNSLLVCVRK